MPHSTANEMHASPHESSAPASGRFVRLGSDFYEPFTEFLSALEAHGDHRFFHPHPFDPEAARAVVARAEAGPDEYWLLFEEKVLAYGMLRGWAEGYEVPSLGLAVSPQYRGRGLARTMMHHLHGRARDRGAFHVRLKVERNNRTAYRLYETLGYVFQDHSPTEFLGVLALANDSRSAA